MTSLLLSAVGVNLDDYDTTPLAQHMGVTPTKLVAGEPNISTVLDTEYGDDVLLVGTGNIDFDARAAAALGVPMVLLTDAPEATVRLSVTHAYDQYATVLGTFRRGEETSLVFPARRIQPVIGPEVFEKQLLSKARNAGARIVLPEGDDDRILEAAAQLLAKDVCELTILGVPEEIERRCQDLTIDLSGATLVDPSTSDKIEEYAAEFARLRAHKGVQIDDARKQMEDISYFATMMVRCGDADGMVSGAAHTTADTIRPALQIIKTSPDVSSVSSIFFVVLPNRLYAVGDCAVNLNPNSYELGEIAAVSAKTAAQFGLDPKVAILSYSTGSSGSGPDVERATAAVTAARSLDDDILIDGPLQFDAAIDPSVAQKKAPDSLVAGHATVLIFPDLEAGNIGYKAIQRMAGALAVGPVLQGLNKPVNDLSRGATVPDIVNTVAITAIQAGGKK